MGTLLAAAQQQQGSDVQHLMEELIKKKAQKVTMVTHDQGHHFAPHIAEAGRKNNGDILKHSTIYGDTIPNQDDEPRFLMKMKNDPDYVQNLPYMYRCPSI